MNLGSIGSAEFYAIATTLDTKAGTGKNKNLSMRRTSSFLADRHTNIIAKRKSDCKVLQVNEKEVFMRLLTVKQYATHINAAESTIRQMCADGKLPAVKIGRGYRIDMYQADDYFKTQIENRPMKKATTKVAGKTRAKTKGANFLAALNEMKRALKGGKSNESICNRSIGNAGYGGAGLATSAS